MRIARLHIVECCIQSRINRQIELICGVVRKRDTGSGSLRVVDQDINSSEGIQRLLDYIFHNRLIVRAGADIRLNRQDLYAVKPFQLFLRVSQLLHVPSGNDDIGAFLCISGSDAVSDGAASAVTQDRSSSSCDDHCFFCQKSHVFGLLLSNCFY